jgi:hypothetical protein
MWAVGDGAGLSDVGFEQKMKMVRLMFIIIIIIIIGHKDVD